MSQRQYSGTIYTCNRCGIEGDNQRTGSPFFSSSAHIHVQFRVKGDGHGAAWDKDLDLCDSCSRVFETWIKGVKKT